MPSDRPAVPAGLPDPQVLARMANEFFTALPSTDAPIAESPYLAAGTRGAETANAVANPEFSSIRATPRAPFHTFRHRRAVADSRYRGRGVA